MGHIYKRLLLSTLVILLLTTGLDKANGVQVVKFNDITGHWAENAIQAAVTKGYVNGYDDASFRPDSNVTRAEFIKLVVAGINGEAPEAASGEQWFIPYIRAAERYGYVAQGQYDASNANEVMSRVEMAQVALRATNAGFREVSLSVDAVMLAAIEAGLIQGMSGGDPAPYGNTTRAQSITIIGRIEQVGNGKQLEVDKYALSMAELAVKKTNMFRVMPEIFGWKQTNPWSVDKLTITSADGLYQAVVDRMVAVDMADPNDPNRNILGDVNQLKWSAEGTFYNVADYPDSYMLVVESHTEFNNDTEGTRYSPVLKGVGITFLGLGQKYDGDANRAGVLNKVAPIVHLPEGIKGYLIPKTGISMEDTITITGKLYALPGTPHGSVHLVRFYTGQ